MLIHQQASIKADKRLARNETRTPGTITNTVLALPLQTNEMQLEPNMCLIILRSLKVSSGPLVASKCCKRARPHASPVQPPPQPSAYCSPSPHLNLWPVSFVLVPTAHAPGRAVHNGAR